MLTAAFWLIIFKNTSTVKDARHARGGWLHVAYHRITGMVIWVFMEQNLPVCIFLSLE